MDYQKSLDYIIKKSFQNFIFKINLYIWIFVIIANNVFILAIITVSFQTIKVVNAKYIKQ